MSTTQEDIINLELIEGESIISVLPDDVEDQQKGASYKNILLLTTKRLVILSRSKQPEALTFISINDIDRITVGEERDHWKVVARPLLMIAGALSSIYIIQIMAIALTIALVLGICAAYLLVDSRNKLQYENISVFTNNISLHMPYKKNQREQALEFVNACFSVKNTTVVSVKNHELLTDASDQDRYISDTRHT